MVLVTVQHAISACRIHPPDLIVGLDAGQIGVIMFFSISGLLVAHNPETKTTEWLRKRLSRVLVPYWLSVAAVLIANRAVNYKPMPAALVVSQFAGTAIWTHPGQLVGVHFWFVSLLLVCYLLGATVRIAPAALPCLIVTAAICGLAGSSYATYLLVFLVSAATAFSGVSPKWRVLTIIALAALSLSVDKSGRFAHPLACLLVSQTTALLATMSVPFPRAAAAPVARVSEFSYHFYLCHGPVCLGTAKLFGTSLLLMLPLGTVLAVFAALALFACESAIRKCFRTSLVSQ